VSPRAAIYARRSTEQRVAEEFKSVTRQVENARAFAVAQGWTVADEHVYKDDGLSGTEFERRPGFTRMMNTLKPRAPFQVLIVSEQKSIGREQFETQYTIKQLAEAGVEIFEYVHGRSLTPKNAMDKVVSSVQGFSDEAHREKTAERMHEAHERLAKAGHVTGGRLFGYRNVDVFKGQDEHGRPVRSHVEREIDLAERPVVLRIFELYDSGYGLKRIAKQLRSEGAVAPRPFHRKDRSLPLPGWSPSTVRAILTREIYHGVIVWNKWRKRNSWGKVDPRPRPDADLIRTSVEQLRIVPEDLWNRVQSRRKETEGRAVRFESGRLSGQPPKHAAPNLLAGLATCGVCGGGLAVETTGGKGGQRYYAYVCYQRRHTGACSNALRVSVETMNEAVLCHIEEHALTPEAVEQVIRLTERDDVAEQQVKLEREQKDIAKRIKRLVDAIESGGDSATLVTRVRELESRRRAIAAEVVALQPVPRLAPAVIENRLAEWRRLLRQSTTQGRAVLQRVLRGRITFTPLGDGHGYEFSGPTRFDRLFTGVVVPRPAFLKDGDVRGTEHIGAEDTFDGDYGRLLERATQLTDKGWRPWWDSNPRSRP
jgi:site-specific DNA recombinase